MKQMLEDIAKPLKMADEAVLRQYSRLTKKWEAKGRSKYSLARKFQRPTNIFIGTSFGLSGGLARVQYPLIGGTVALFGLYCMESFSNDRYSQSNAETFQEGVKVENWDPIVTSWKNVSKGIRLPLFISGVALMGKGTLGLVDYVRNHEPTSLQNALSEFSLGYALFGNASSMYIRDSDPKLLDKAPAWKTAYNFVKEKISGLIPQPTPALEPIPVRINSNYEGGEK